MSCMVLLSRITDLHIAPSWCALPVMKCRSSHSLCKEKSPLGSGLFRITDALQRVVHVELNGVSCHIETLNIILLKRDVGIDHVIGEYATLC